MPIEVEQLFEGAYFLQRGKKIRIRAEDFPDLPIIISTLEPILIERAELSLLRFSNMDMATGKVVRATSLGYALWLKPGIGGKWYIGIDEHLTNSFVYYIHQLQRIYFSLFEEHLRYSVDEITKGSKPSNNYYFKPEHLVGSIVVESTNPRHKSGLTQATVTEPLLDELYYVTKDLRLLVRSKRLGYAIWEIVNHSPLFTFGGKNWGLKLAAGNTIKEEDTIAAGKWLRDLFSRSNIKFS